MSDHPLSEKWAKLLRDFEPVTAEDAAPVEAPTIDELFERVSLHTYERDGAPVPIPPSPRMVGNLFDYQPMRERYRCKGCGHVQHRDAGSLLWLYGVPVTCVKA